MEVPYPLLFSAKVRVSHERRGFAAGLCPDASKRYARTDCAARRVAKLSYEVA
jgi:hypothetical protein